MIFKYHYYITVFWGLYILFSGIIPLDWRWSLCLLLFQAKLAFFFLKCHMSSWHIIFSLSLFKKDFTYLFLEREERWEKEREKNINVWLPLACPLPGTWSATQACALTGNQTLWFAGLCSKNWAMAARLSPSFLSLSQIPHDILPQLSTVYLSVYYSSIQ